MLRLHALQIQVEKLKKELQRAKHRQKYGLATGALVILLLGGGLYLVKEQTSKTEQRIINTEQDVTQLKTELEQQRDYIKTVANIYTQQQAQLAELKLSDAELFNRALTVAAEQAGVPAAELEESINLFVAAVRANPGAEFMDLALADFAERNFSSAARNAALAGDEGEAKLHAAKEVAARVKNEVETAEKQIRESRNLEGQALYADKHYAEAVQAFEKALAATSRSEQPETWTELQGRLGIALTELAKVSTGDAIALHRQQAIAAYRAALQVYTREALPQGWAMTQHNMANALRNQALAAEGIKREQLLAEAVEAYRAALEVRTREALPQGWAATQNNMAVALSDQALAAEGIKREPLLAEAVEAYRATLQVYTREALPQDWARTQNNMASALSDQAQAAEGIERARLLSKVVVAKKAALEIYTAEIFPEWHAESIALISEIEAEIRQLTQH